MYSSMNNAWPQAGLVSYSSSSYSAQMPSNDRGQSLQYLQGQELGYASDLNTGNAGLFPPHGLYESSSQSYDLSQYTQHPGPFSTQSQYSSSTESYDMSQYTQRAGRFSTQAQYSSVPESSSQYTQHAGTFPPQVQYSSSPESYNSTPPTRTRESAARNGNPYPNTRSTQSPSGLSSGPLTDRRNSASNGKGKHGSAQIHHVYPDYLNLPADYRKDGSTHTQLGPQRSRRGSEHSSASPYNHASSRHHKEIAIKPSRYILDDDPRSIFNSNGRSGPTNHMRVPQKVFYDDQDAVRGNSHRDASIIFQAKGFHEYGVRVSSVVERMFPDIVGARDKVAKGLQYREIKMKLVWPGYYKFPCERRIKTQRGEIDRQGLLVAIANAILEYIRLIQIKGETCDPGLEAWKLGGSGGLTGDELFITGLIHRGGNVWQPEVWSPIFV